MTEPVGIEPVRVFFSYSHEDELLRKQIEKHLSILKRSGMIADWNDRQIEAGDEWAGEIDQNLDNADIILLLISPDFIRSDYCWSIEMERALERHEDRSARVIPIILRPCLWKRASFSKLQVFPRNARAITDWENRDSAFFDVVEGIEAIAQQLIDARKPKDTPPPPPEPDNDARRQVQCYRQEVLHCIRNNGYEISDMIRTHLEDYRNDLKLSVKRAIEIEQKILGPYQKYTTYYKEIIQKNYSLTGMAQELLQRKQKRLGLNDEEVKAIEGQIDGEQEKSLVTNERSNASAEVNLCPSVNAELQVEVEQKNWSTTDGTTDVADPLVNAEPHTEAEQEDLLTADGTFDGLDNVDELDEIDPSAAAPANESAASDDLSSEKGIDYTRLRDLLSIGNWKTADHETYCVMIKIVGREEGESISDKELLDFPSTDLRTIDQLWFKYSNERFGFRVQKRIYAEIIGTLTRSYPGDGTWREFGSRVGWFKDGGWLYLTYITFNASAPPGHLPSLRFCEETIASRWWGGCSALAKRFENL